MGTVKPPKKEPEPDWVRVGESLYRYRPSGTYLAYFWRNGKQIKKSLKTKDQAHARRELSALLAGETPASQPLILHLISRDILPTCSGTAVCKNLILHLISRDILPRRPKQSNAPTLILHLISRDILPSGHEFLQGRNQVTRR